MGKWLAQFKEKYVPETPNQGTAIGAIGTQEMETQQNPASLFQRVSDELGRLWQPGTRQHIEQHRPELAQEIDAAEAEVNRCWLAVDDGTGTLDDFKYALAAWKDANLRAIRAYNDTLPLTLAGADPDEVARAREQLRRRGYFLMDSRALGERIAVVETEADRSRVLRGVPAYTFQEIRLLQQGVEAGNIVNIGDLRLLHAAKRDLKGVILK